MPDSNDPTIPLDPLTLADLRELAELIIADALAAPDDRDHVEHDVEAEVDAMFRGEP